MLRAVEEKGVETRKSRVVEETHQFVLGKRIAAVFQHVEQLVLVADAANRLDVFEENPEIHQTLVGNELGVAERKRGWEQVLAVLDVGIGLGVRLLGFVVRLRIPVLEGPVRLDGGEVRSVHRVVVVEVHGEEDDPLVALDVHHPKMPYDADGIVLVALPIVDLLAVEPLRHHTKPPEAECPPAALLQVVRQSAELL